jgi:hypothetical protein
MKQNRRRRKRRGREEEGAFHTVNIPHTGSFTESCDVFTHNGAYGGIMGRTRKKARLFFILGSGKHQGVEDDSRGEAQCRQRGLSEEEDTWADSL